MTPPATMLAQNPPASRTVPATAALPGGLVAAIRPLDPTAPWIPAWKALGESAAIPNPFYEPACALAALPSAGQGVRMLLVADRPPDEPGARLIAAWPHRITRRWGLPLSAMMGWTHGYAPLGVPLLDGDDPARALAALLAAPGVLGEPRRLLFPNAPADGLFRALLDRSAPSLAAYWPHARGMLDATALDATARAAYLDHLSGNRRRRLRRARRKLDAPGPVTFDMLAEAADLPAALDAHIALEVASWKGRVGTALAQRPDEAALLRDTVARLAADGRVRIARLRRDEQLLASMVLPLAGEDAFVLKVAHDESDPSAAPGVQLVHRVTDAFLADPTLGRIDSCAPPGFALATLFWTERRAIAHLLVEAGRDPLFPLARGLERARETVARLRLAWRERRASV